MEGPCWSFIFSLSVSVLLLLFSALIIFHQLMLFILLFLFVYFFSCSQEIKGKDKIETVLDFCPSFKISLFHVSLLSVLCYNCGNFQSLSNYSLQINPNLTGTIVNKISHHEYGYCFHQLCYLTKQKETCQTTMCTKDAKKDNLNVIQCHQMTKVTLAKSLNLLPARNQQKVVIVCNRSKNLILTFIIGIYCSNACKGVVLCLPNLYFSMELFLL